jgi:hypothetical protein
MFEMELKFKIIGREAFFCPASVGTGESVLPLR